MTTDYRKLSQAALTLEKDYPLSKNEKKVIAATLREVESFLKMFVELVNNNIEEDWP